MFALDERVGIKLKCTLYRFGGNSWLWGGGGGTKTCVSDLSQVIKDWFFPSPLPPKKKLRFDMWLGGLLQAHYIHGGWLILVGSEPFGPFDKIVCVCVCICNQ